MKVALDARGAEGELLGIGNYIVEVADELSKQKVEVLLLYSSEPETTPLHKNTKVLVLNSKNKYIFEQILVPYTLKKQNVDIYHATANVGVPLFKTTPQVLTLHDTIPLDLKNYFSFSRYPFFSRWLYKVRQFVALRNVDKVIVLSKFQKEKLIKSYGIGEDKVATIPSGVSLEKTPNKLPARFKNTTYILNNGGIDRRKNIEGVIKTFSKVAKDFPKLKLVITGENELMKRSLQNLVRKFKLSRRVVFTGFLEKDVYSSLVFNASCVCYPSFTEGFGQPILDAYAAGVPVITSKTTSLGELGKDGAVLVDPGNVEEIANALREILVNPRLARKMIKKGKEKVGRYSWQTSATETLGVYKEVLGRGKNG